MHSLTDNGIEPGSEEPRATTKWLVARPCRHGVASSQPGVRPHLPCAADVPAGYGCLHVFDIRQGTEGCKCAEALNGGLHPATGLQSVLSLAGQQPERLSDAEIPEVLSAQVSVGAGQLKGNVNERCKAAQVLLACFFCLGPQLLVQLLQGQAQSQSGLQSHLQSEGCGS